jgi:hypothetical protein
MQLHLKKLLILVVLLFHTWQTPAQNCLIESDSILQSSYNKNKVKEVKVYKGGAIAASALTTHYFINEKGCISRKLTYDNNYDTPAKFEHYTNQSNTALTYVHYEKNNEGNFIIREKETKTFSRNGKLLKSVAEKHNDYLMINTNLYDTSNSSRSNLQIVKIDSATKDTFQILTNINDLLTEIYIIKNKKKGAWFEQTKRITYYKNGQFDSFTEFIDGQLVKQYTQEDLNKTADDLLQPIADEVVMPDQPLPPDDSQLVDIIYTNDLIKYTNSAKQYSKFKVVKHYTDVDKSELNYTNVYYTKSNLLYKVISPDAESVMNETYQYVFRK